MSSARKLGGIATAGTPGEGGDKNGFRLQPESSRISPSTGSRQSPIFGRHCLTMDIHLYPFSAWPPDTDKRVGARSITWLRGSTPNTALTVLPPYPCSPNCCQTPRRACGSRQL